jgi:hypothetical protein
MFVNSRTVLHVQQSRVVNYTLLLHIPESLLHYIFYPQQPSHFRFLRTSISKTHFRTLPLRTKSQDTSTSMQPANHFTTMHIQIFLAIMLKCLFSSFFNNMSMSMTPYEILLCVEKSVLAAIKLVIYLYCCSLYRYDCSKV